MEEIRINKYLSDMGICSRREADRLIMEGKVLVDGRPALTGMKIRRDQVVICDGKRAAEPEKVLLAVNKPRGIVCTTSQKDRAMNSVEMVDYPVRVYPVGRLDKDSEGLIFLTNQGELVDQMMRGSHGHEKEYVVRVDRPVTGEFAGKMAAGVYLEELDVTTRPCKVRITGEREFHIILTQGLNRQIRRKSKTFGYHVRELCRIRIMNIKLGSLETGAWRKVTPEEYGQLTEMLQTENDQEG